MRFVKTLFIACLAMVIFAAPVRAAEEADTETQQKTYPNRIIIRTKPETKRTEVTSLLETYGLTEVGKLRLSDTIVVQAPGEYESQVIEALGKESIVVYAEPDYLARSLEGDGSNLNSIITSVTTPLPDAWIQPNAKYLDVAILDTGITTDHPDIPLAIVPIRNFSWSTNDDSVGHGTKTAITTSTNIAHSLQAIDTDVIGRVMNVKVLDDAGTGYYSWITDGIIWAVDNGAEMIVMQLSGSFQSRTMEESVQYALDEGVIVVSVPDESSDKHSYPSGIAGVNTPRDTDEDEIGFSDQNQGVNLATPGVSIISADATILGLSFNAAGTPSFISAIIEFLTSSSARKDTIALHNNISSAPLIQIASKPSYCRVLPWHWMCVP